MWSRRSCPCCIYSEFSPELAGETRAGSNLYLGLGEIVKAIWLWPLRLASCLTSVFRMWIVNLGSLSKRCVGVIKRMTGKCHFRTVFALLQLTHASGGIRDAVPWNCYSNAWFQIPVFWIFRVFGIMNLWCGSRFFLRLPEPRANGTPVIVPHS